MRDHDASFLRQARSVAADGLRLVASVLPAQELAPVRLTIWSWNKLADILEPPAVRLRNVPQAPRPPVVTPAPAAVAAPVAAAVSQPLEIDATQLKQMLAGESGPQLIDVREPMETASGVIPGAQLIPMRFVLERVGDLRQTDQPIVVYCAHGVRSANVVIHLRDRGISAVSLEGGMSAWHAVQGRVEPPSTGGAVR